MIGGYSTVVNAHINDKICYKYDIITDTYNRIADTISLHKYGHAFELGGRVHIAFGYTYIGDSMTHTNSNPD